jgi:uncharacterized protein (DUF1810 family)
MTEKFFLDRFVSAQAEVYPSALSELREGAKRGHWMWFVFPQLKGLGRSEYAFYYGIGSLEEASAYLRHPVLGPRLVQCTQAVNAVDDRSVHEIFGSPDDMKFRSSMTLFASAGEDDTVFRTALDKYFNGRPDPLTLELLR